MNPFFWDLILVFLKTTFIYWIIIIGMRLIGRRAIGQLGPHEFILIALLTKIMADQIVTKELGLWGNIVGGGTLFLYVAIIDANPKLRQWIQGSPLYLVKEGQINYDLLKKHHLSTDDLYRVARQYGHKHYDVFESIVMERDGQFSAVFK